jgi:hypothetical protein
VSRTAHEVFTVAADAVPFAQPHLDAGRLKSFSFQLFETDDWIMLLQDNDLRVNEFVNIGHHIGPSNA